MACWVLYGLQRRPAARQVGGHRNSFFFLTGPSRNRKPYTAFWCSKTSLHAAQANGPSLPFIALRPVSAPPSERVGVCRVAGVTTLDSGSAPSKNSRQRVNTSRVAVLTRLNTSTAVVLTVITFEHRLNVNAPALWWNALATRASFALPRLRWVSLHLFPDGKGRQQVCLPESRPRANGYSTCLFDANGYSIVVLSHQLHLRYSAWFYSLAWCVALYNLVRPVLYLATYACLVAFEVIISATINLWFAFFGHLSPPPSPFLGARMTSFRQQLS